jgi:hypothetical protein
VAALLGLPLSAVDAHSVSQPEGPHAAAGDGARSTQAVYGWGGMQGAMGGPQGLGLVMRPRTLLLPPPHAAPGAAAAAPAAGPVVLRVELCSASGVSASWEALRVGRQRARHTHTHATRHTPHTPHTHTHAPPAGSGGCKQCPAPAAPYSGAAAHVLTQASPARLRSPTVQALGYELLLRAYGDYLPMSVRDLGSVASRAGPLRRALLVTLEAPACLRPGAVRVSREGQWGAGVAREKPA